MRRVTIQAPAGRGAEIAKMALSAGAARASVHQVHSYSSNAAPVVRDVVDVETATPTAKRLVERLMAAPFYDSATFAFSIVHPRAIVADDPPGKETYPFAVPSIDVYEELWQFSHVTVSLILRVFLAALLLAYGMIEMNLPIMIAGLLFLPYHHQMLSTGLGLWTRDWRLAGQGAWALLVSTALIIVAGACVALVTHPPVKFDQFGAPLTAFLIALVVGVAAGFAAADDAGRRELIGLAATAHITVLPAWFGIVLVFGTPDTKSVGERLLSFGISVATLTAAATVVFALIGMRGRNVRRFPGPR